MPEMDTVGVHATNFLASVTGRPGDDRTSIIDMSGRLMLHGAVSRTGGSSRENIVVEGGDGNLWVKIPFKLERAGPRTRSWRVGQAWPQDWDGDAPAEKVGKKRLEWIGKGPQGATVVHWKTDGGKVGSVRISSWRRQARKHEGTTNE